MDNIHFCNQVEKLSFQILIKERRYNNTTLGTEFVMFEHIMISQFFGMFHMSLQSFHDQIASCLILFIFLTNGKPSQGIKIKNQWNYILFLIIYIDRFLCDFNGIQYNLVFSTTALSLPFYDYGIPLVFF